MTEVAPNMALISEDTERAIQEAIESASPALIEQYIDYLNMPEEIASLPYYRQSKAWISRAKFGQFLRALAGQPDSPLKVVSTAQKRPVPPSPTTSVLSTTGGIQGTAAASQGDRNKRQKPQNNGPQKDLLKVTSRLTETTAYLVDLSSQSAPLNKERKPITIDTWLRQEDQDSWLTVSNGNHSRKGVQVPLLGATECRTVAMKCRGVVACSEFDPALLEGYERRDNDLEKHQALLEAQELQRATEAATPCSVLASYYCAVTQSACPKSGCLGSAQMVRFTECAVPKQGKFWYISCSQTTPLERQHHCLYYIPTHINENELLKLFNGEGSTLEGLESFLGKHCTQIFHPTTGLKQKSCKSKPSHEAKQAAIQAYQSTGGIAAKPSTVDSGPTTLVLLGESLSQKYPSWHDRRRLQEFVGSQRLEEAPLGLEWMEGVLTTGRHNPCC
ncbi:hypothetical protein CALCODRAFT_506085 [Calocera cornea HHB12733]|uniref:Uncharacterized protein n=1 Tax=Calocera cornea HHB12733 TaxID=1353952 RepID=A0A165J837_9BASI|nr:hypothetical protein CALCODRAFT_506085 [Calocera cornea HHB12733]